MCVTGACVQCSLCCSPWASYRHVYWHSTSSSCVERPSPGDRLSKQMFLPSAVPVQIYRGAFFPLGLYLVSHQLAAPSRPAELSGARKGQPGPCSLPGSRGSGRAQPCSEHPALPSDTVLQEQQPPAPFLSQSAAQWRCSVQALPKPTWNKGD